jgi:hypothetical protein
MPYKAKVFKVMIASPNDVGTERNEIRDAIFDWNNVHSDKEEIVLMPVGWESHSSPAMGDRPQGIINKQLLATCDLLIAVFWTRLGSPTGKARSGTVEEIEKHLKSGKPAMIYFSSVPVMPESVDQEQYSALSKFKEELRTRGLYETYDSIAMFKDKIKRQLAQTIIRYFLPKKKGHRNVAQNETMNIPTTLPTLSREARLLLTEACRDKAGIVLRLRTSGGLTVQTNGRNLVDSRDPKIEASWEDAVRDLRDLGLLQLRGGKEEVFSLTGEGYRIAELLRDQTYNIPSVVLPTYTTPATAVFGG